MIRKLRALTPPGDTYRIKTHSARVEYWTFTSLLPRIAEPRGKNADWLIVPHPPHGAGAPGRDAASARRLGDPHGGMILTSPGSQQRMRASSRWESASAARSACGAHPPTSRAASLSCT